MRDGASSVHPAAQPRPHARAIARGHVAGGRCHGRRSGGTGGQRAGRGGDAHVGASRHVHLGVRGEVRNALGRRALRKCHSCFDVAAAIISFHFITGRKRLKRMWLLAGIYIYIYIYWNSSVPNHNNTHTHYFHYIHYCPKTHLFPKRNLPHSFSPTSEPH